MSIARKLSRFSKQEVAYLFEHAKRTIHEAGLTFLRAPSQKEYGRILIVTSAKVGNAPTRNKIRRRLKSIFYTHELYKQPYDVGIIVKKNATNLSFDQLQSAVLKALT